MKSGVGSLLNRMVDLGDSTAVGRRIPADRMPRAAVAVRAIVGMTGLLLMVALFLLTPPESTRYFVLFLFAALAADLLFTVRVGGAIFSVSDTFVFAYLPIGGPVGTAALAVALTVLTWVLRASLDRPISTPLFVLFSVGQAAIVTLASGGIAILLVADMTLRPSQSLMLAIVFFAIGHFVISASINTLVTAARGLPAIRPFLVPSVGLWPAVGLAIALPLAVALALIARTEAGVVASVSVVLAVLGVVSLIVRLNIRLRERTRDLTVLNRIGTRMAAAIDSAELLRILARESRRVLGWEGLVIATFANEDDQELDLVFLTGEGAEIAHRRVSRHQGLVGEAIRKGSTVRWERSRSDTTEPEPGVTRPWSVVVAPMHFDERIIGAIAMQSTRSDTWDARQIELLEIMAAQAAVALRNAELFRREQQARRELDEFFSVVTHEIRNPLTTIRGYTDMILKETDDPLVRESGEIIRDESQRILRLAQDLLDASRAREGKFSVDPANVDLIPIVERLVSRWTATADVAISVERQEPSVEAWVDAARLGQVLENLVSNAIKYGEGAPVILRVRATPGGGARIEVRDEGPGIPAENSARLFERFYRIDDRGEVQGSGLGLYISREIVRAHGGEITVESAEGKGTTFVIDLPPRPAID